MYLNPVGHICIIAEGRFLGHCGRLWLCLRVVVVRSLRTPFLTWEPFLRFLLRCSNVGLCVLQFRHARFSRCWYMTGRCATENLTILAVDVLAVNRPLPVDIVSRSVLLTLHSVLHTLSVHF